MFFIAEGEFEVTKTIKPEEASLKLTVQSKIKKALKQEPSPASNQKVIDNLRRKALPMLGSKSTGNLLRRSQLPTPLSILEKESKPKPVQLYLLGQYEIFGMEDIVEIKKERSFTVTCASTKASCYIMKRGDF